MALDRRDFLKFMGKGALALSVLNQLPACASSQDKKFLDLPFTPINPSAKDDLILSQGLNYRVLLKEKDSIGQQIKFGASCDYNAFIPFDHKNPYDGLLWTNHEVPVPIFASGFEDKPSVGKTKEQVDLEMEATGGSLVRCFRDSQGLWQVDLKSSMNKRFTGKTKIPFSGSDLVHGRKEAIGTIANCAGGVTPWGTILTCEENYDQFYGEWDYSPKPGQKVSRKNPVIKYQGGADLGWYKHYDHPSTHYGWVVEIHPLTGQAKKLVPLGRFAHEGATCVKAKNNCTVVYMGDDDNNRCLYKFIADRPGSLESGTLYVANLEKGRWLPLTMKSHPDFKIRFKNQTELLVRAREAARMVGGTELDRPEDIEINPHTGDLIVSLTNNKPQSRPFGSILQISEKNQDPLSLELNSKTWISGGVETGLSCPDNLAFDKSGNLWVANDISGSALNAPPYTSFGNNGLYFVPMSGPQAGKVFQVGSAPAQAEFTGFCFTPDGESLIISVQHPGEHTTDLKNPLSHWPERGSPKSSVIIIHGESLSKMVNYRV